MVSLFAKVKIFRFGPKTMDYSLLTEIEVVFLSSSAEEVLLLVATASAVCSQPSGVRLQSARSHAPSPAPPAPPQRPAQGGGVCCRGDGPQWSHRLSPSRPPGALVARILGSIDSEAYTCIIIASELCLVELDLSLTGSLFACGREKVYLDSLHSWTSL